MVPFKTKSDQNNTSKRTRFHQSFQNFLSEHAPEHLCSWYHYLYIKVAIFYLEIFQNIDQNASIVACFQKFHLELSTPYSNLVAI